MPVLFGCFTTFCHTSSSSGSSSTIYVSKETFQTIKYQLWSHVSKGYSYNSWWVSTTSHNLCCLKNLELIFAGSEVLANTKLIVFCFFDDGFFFP